jgi:hypothetical protein
MNEADSLAVLARPEQKRKPMRASIIIWLSALEAGRTSCAFAPREGVLDRTRPDSVPASAALEEQE